MAYILEVAKNGDVHELTRLIQDGVSVDGDGFDGVVTPLILAAQGGHLICVQKLVESGCNIKHRDYHGWTALHYALAEGHWDCFQLLSCAESYSDLKCIKKLAHFLNATQQGAFGQLSTLTAKSKIIKDLSKLEKAAFIFFLVHHRCPSIILHGLINGRKDMNSIYHCGMNLIIYATITGNNEALEAFLAQYPDLSICDELGKTALNYAVEKNCLKSLEILLKVHSKEDENKHVLEKTLKLSVLREQYECLLILLKWWKDNLRSAIPAGELLLGSAKTGSLQCLEVMLDLGTDASWFNDLGETALMYSVIKDNFDCFERLIIHGVQVDVVDCDGDSALMHAVQWIRPKYVAKLLEIGADVNLIDSNDMTAIAMASCQNNTEILELILSSPRVSRNLRIENHAIAFKLAAKFCNIKALILLMNHGIFRWCWMDDDHEISPEVIAQAAVKSKTHPGSFYFSSETTSLLKLAFYYGDEGTARFLMANLYLSEYDVKVLKYDITFIDHIRKKGIKTYITLLNQLISQPWSLQTLSFLSISSAFESSLRQNNFIGQSNMAIRQLPLPESLLNKLMFQSIVSEVCVDKWRYIGINAQDKETEEQVDLMSRASPIWTRQTLPDSCEQNECNNNDEGFRKRFETMRLRRRIWNGIEKSAYELKNIDGYRVYE